MIWLVVQCLVSACLIHALKPVILIPGNGGSQLEGRVDESWQGGNCPKPTDWQRLWVNVWQFLPQNVECWSKKMELEYSPLARRSWNKPGLHTRVPGFGGTDTVEYLDPSLTASALVGKVPYFAAIVDELVSWGYERGVTVKGAPYDFRFAPHSQSAYFFQLKGAIESAFRQNGGVSKVVLISHSAGALFATYFLNQQSDSWKQRHVDSLVTMGGCWDGSPTVMYTMASGFNMNISIVEPLAIRKQQRTSETNSLLLPRQPTFNANKVFIKTNAKNYSISNLNEFFVDIGYPNGRFQLQDVSVFAGDDYALRHPGVHVHCWYGVGVATPETFLYTRNQFPDGQPDSKTFTDGDGMVTSESLNRCAQWRNDIGMFDSVSVNRYRGQGHLEMLSNREMLDDLRQILL